MQLISNHSLPDLSSGFDIFESALESTFGTCDANSDGQINKDEIHQENCIGTLDTMFGLTESQLPELFNLTDTNADMIISSEEALTAFHRIEEFNRGISPSWFVYNAINFDDDEKEMAKSIVISCYNNNYDSDNNSGISDSLLCVMKRMFDDILGSNWEYNNCVHAKQYTFVSSFDIANFSASEWKYINFGSADGAFEIRCFFAQ